MLIVSSRFERIYISRYFEFLIEMCFFIASIYSDYNINIFKDMHRKFGLTIFFLDILSGNPVE